MLNCGGFGGAIHAAFAASVSNAPSYFFVPSH
jgi:hypothetical protein